MTILVGSMYNNSYICCLNIEFFIHHRYYNQFSLNCWRTCGNIDYWFVNRCRGNEEERGMERKWKQPTDRCALLIYHHFSAPVEWYRIWRRVVPCTYMNLYIYMYKYRKRFEALRRCLGFYSYINFRYLVGARSTTTKFRYFLCFV